MANYHKNADGLVQRYGPYTTKEGNKRPVEEAGVDDLKVLRVNVTYKNLPAPVDGDDGVAKLPAGAVVESAILYVDEAFNSAAPTTDTLEVGASEQDGTAIDAAGFIAATTVSSLTAGARIEGAGALVGADVGSVNAYLAAVASATLTAGTAQLVVKYRLPTQVEA